MMLSIVVGAGAASAASDHHYSIVLPRTGDDRNIIFALRAESGEVVPFSPRLRNALDAAGAPPSVLVNSFSTGQGTHAYADDLWHGALLWSVTPGSRGLFPTDLFYEPSGDRESDLYISHHRPQTGFDLNLKAVEENSANLPSPHEQLLATPTLGLPGGRTGAPLTASPENLVGFDARLTPAKGAVYFTISESFSGEDGAGNLTTFRPSQVILEVSGKLFVYQDHQDLDIDPADRIDALDVDAEYYKSLGNEPSLLFSLTADSPSVNGVGATLEAAALYHSVVGVPGHSLHRSAFAAGVEPDTSDIDSVVSIDPADLGLELPYFEIYQFGGQVEVLFASEVSETQVFWDFQPVTVIDGVAVESIEPGDRVRIDAYGVIDGVLHVQHEWVEVDAEIDNPATSLAIADSGSTTNITFGPAQATGEWELLIDDAPPVFLPAGETQYPVTFTDGMHAVRLHYRNDWNQRSEARAVAYFVKEGPPAVQSVELTPLSTDPPRVRLEWTSSPGAGVQTVEIVTTVPGGASTVSVPGTSWTSGDLEYGVYGFELRQFASSVASAPVRVNHAVTPPLKLNWVQGHIDDSPEGPGQLQDSAYLDGNCQVVVIDAATSNEYLRYSINGRFFERASLNASRTETVDSIHAVTSLLLPLANPFVQSIPIGGGTPVSPPPPGVRQRLIWAVLLDGVSTLVVTTEGGAPLAINPLPATVDNITAMAYDAERERILLAAGGKLFAIPAPPEELGSANLVAEQIPLLSWMDIQSVTMVERGYYELAGPVGPTDSLTHFAVIDANDDTLVASIEADASLTELGGVVYAKHGAAGRPQYFVSSGAELHEYFGRDPRGVVPQPAELNPLARWTRLGDLNGDGVAFGSEDFDLVRAIIADPSVIDTLLCPASYDLDQDGEAGSGDLLIFIQVLSHGFWIVGDCVEIPSHSSLTCEVPSCGP
ncbi:MAG: hypothetical protein AAF488_03635 [Planctomycetota bacterium]